jgi:hypothetical protein
MLLPHRDLNLSADFYTSVTMTVNQSTKALQNYSRFSVSPKLKTSESLWPRRNSAITLEQEFILEAVSTTKVIKIQNKNL